MSIQIQNFYKATLSLDWSIGTGNFYVSIKPVITNGWLVISPNNATIREIIAYTSTGTDANGDYVVVSVRGVGGTTQQIHTVGEPIRMNVTAEYWKYMGDAIDAIVAAGAPNADTITKGLVEIATDAEVIAGTNIGGTGASLVATPGQINLKASKFTDVQVFTTIGTNTWTKPTDARIIQIQMIGGGGGGANNTGGNPSCYSGSGAEVVNISLSASIITPTVIITVGDGGISNTNGQDTSFGSYIKANKGRGGDNITPEVSTGFLDILIPNFAGNTRKNGNLITASGGGGGIQTHGTPTINLPIGGNGGAEGIGADTQAHANGQPGGLYGAGGGGAYQVSTPFAGLGGKGGQGIAVITTYF